MEELGRNRRNRAALLRAGREMGRAFTVRELHRSASADQPALGLTTAYRAVERLREEGFVEEAGQRGGEATFVFCTADGHHHHVVCVDCGAVATLEGCTLEPVRKAVSASGFQLLDDALGSLPARCAACSRDGR
jgi:Fur family ferric uptake transcriptional regulator